MNLTQRPAKDRKVLAKDIDDTALDLAPASDHTITQESLLFNTKTHRPVGRKHVQLSECAGIQQSLDPLSGRKLALGMLTIDPRLPAAQLSLLSHLSELLDPGIRGHVHPLMIN